MNPSVFSINKKEKEISIVEQFKVYFYCNCQKLRLAFLVTEEQFLPRGPVYLYKSPILGCGLGLWHKIPNGTNCAEKLLKCKKCNSLEIGRRFKL